DPRRAFARRLASDHQFLIGRRRADRKTRARGPWPAPAAAATQSRDAPLARRAERGDGRTREARKPSKRAGWALSSCTPTRAHVGRSSRKDNKTAEAGASAVSWGSS